MEEKVEAAERVMDLLIALLNTRTRLSKAQIRRAVRGYHGDARAFERTFERDKDLLRTIGVPIVVERGLVHEDDVGYRIDLESFAATTTDFTPEEIGVLSIAASVFSDVQWRSVAGRGVTKVRGLGPGVQHVPPPFRLAIRPPEPTFETITEAISRRRAVEFDYTALTSPKVRRHVQPWRVLARNRAWYLIGFDTDRGAPRAFRLSRIDGPVVAVGEEDAFEAPEHVDVGELLTRQRAEPVTVTVAIAPGRAELLRARSTPVGRAGTRDLATITTTEVLPLLDEIAGFGPDVVLLEPVEYRERLVGGFRAVVGVAGAD
ncbi:MAG: helix-turn-helix transcriptional regulator [Actinomycetota bacterium]